MTCRSLSALLLASTVLAIAAPAQAQSDTAAQNLDQPGGDIVVTARRREESAQTVPVSVTAFNSEMLREKAVVSTQDLTYTTPGLNVAPQTSRDTPRS
ncbi:hypothetical protein ACFSLT_23915 [Novosphingobium resinovorum]